MLTEGAKPLEICFEVQAMSYYSLSGFLYVSLSFKYPYLSINTAEHQKLIPYFTFSVTEMYCKNITKFNW